MKYDAGKRKGPKTMHVREEDAQYILSEEERRIRGDADQVAHMVRLHRAVVQQIFGGFDDIDVIVARIKEWKSKAEGK